MNIKTLTPHVVQILQDNEILEEDDLLLFIRKRNIQEKNYEDF